jgi:hypothetical protein
LASFSDVSTFLTFQGCAFLSPKWGSEEPRNDIYQPALLYTRPTDAVNRFQAKISPLPCFSHAVALYSLSTLNTISGISRITPPTNHPFGDLHYHSGISNLYHDTQIIRLRGTNSQNFLVSSLRYCISTFQLSGFRSPFFFFKEFGINFIFLPFLSVACLVRGLSMSPIQSARSFTITRSCPFPFRFIRNTVHSSFPSLLVAYTHFLFCTYFLVMKRETKHISLVWP